MKKIWRLGLAVIAFVLVAGVQQASAVGPDAAQYFSYCAYDCNECYYAGLNCGASIYCAYVSCYDFN